MTKSYKRWQEKIVIEAMKTRRVLLLSGPRQCGKITLCQAIASDQVIYRTLDDLMLLQSARNNPVAFISHSAQMMIIDEIQHEPNLLLAIKQAVDKDKLFMTDCGLMAALLKWGADTVVFDVDRLGKLVETFIFNELMAQIDCGQGVYEIFQYRDKDKREIDFIIEREDGALLGIEVKSGSTIDPKSLRHLKWFQQNLCENRTFRGIVLYAGEHLMALEKNIWAVPISLLWSKI